MSGMALLSINRGAARALRHDGREVLSGICKTAVTGPVLVTALGVEGDVQVDRENHGGPDKAVYAYTIENYRFFQEMLGVEPFVRGHFGENFTVSGMPDEAVHLGDVFEVGSVVVQVTQPRVPCFKLGMRMGDPHFVKTFLRSGRVGFYLRVLREGKLQGNEPIRRLVADPHRLSIRECMLAQIKGPTQRSMIERVLAVPALSAAWREELERRLQSH